MEAEKIENYSMIDFIELHQTKCYVVMFFFYNMTTRLHIISLLMIRATHTNGSNFVDILPRILLHASLAWTDCDSWPFATAILKIWKEENNIPLNSAVINLSYFMDTDAYFCGSSYSVNYWLFNISMSPSCYKCVEKITVCNFHYCDFRLEIKSTSTHNL